MKKINKFNLFKLLINTFFICVFLVSTLLGTFLFITVKNEKLKIEPESLVSQTIIYDNHMNQIEVIGESNDYRKIEEIPQVMIDALLSIEDNEFYYHKGINTKRIILSFVNNIFSSSTQGGSTITQQLIKNTALTNEKTYTRKVKEAYLSIMMEKEYTKEEILELYFNKVYFEQSVPGINYASKIFFNKDISLINYLEASILASLVKSPSYYYPFTYPERVNERKNLVLKAMLENNTITSNQYNFGINIHAKDLLVKKDAKLITSYPYQAYLDIVYEEVKAICNKDLYTHPLIVETYLDTYLQTHIDKIQQDKVISFTDEEQQIGGVVIDNDNSKIIGVVGGRNYNGKKLFNRGYHLKRNPASTIKPLLSYPLAIEHLSFHPLTTIKDEPYIYKGTSINVNNADKKYLGPLSLIESIGYSRNTCAVKTFDQVVDKIGIKEVTSYLKDLNLYDGGNITSSYSLGGMMYGISPFQVAGAYSCLANHGKFLLPSTIKRIKDYNGKVLYERDVSYKKVLSEESADLITYSLKKVMDNNYLNINVCKPKGIDVACKTGTNAYESSTIIKNNYPKNADKDIWLAGYSKNHTCVIWTGFDKSEYQKNYFTSNDSRKKISKLVFKSIMETINKKGVFEYSSSLQEISLVKGLDETYLPNEFTPSSYIVKTLINPNKTSVKPLPNLTIEEVNDVSCFTSNNYGIFQINNPLIEDKIYSYFYGDKTYLMEVTLPNKNKEIHTSKDGYFEYEFKEKGKYTIEFSITFFNNTFLKGSSYKFTYSKNDFL